MYNYYYFYLQRIRQGMTLAMAEESAKSNAMMRCCKDLGIASELWDPNFIQKVNISAYQ